VLTLLLIAGLASGCSTDQVTSQASDSPSPTLIGREAACDEAALADTAEGVISPDEKVDSIDGFGCADGWAYAFVTIGPADGGDSGNYTMTMVFQAEGQFWVPKDPMDVCGSASTGSSQPVAPGDAQVPAAIWQDACWTN
jgi:hypothetical protein